MPLPKHDAFAPITESAPLVEWLRERTARDGRITFRDFMDAALYHPQHGYYPTHAGAMTRAGDYVTSPEVHPVFGALVAKQIRQMWDLMSRPAVFDIVELGGGRGALARDIIEWASHEPEFARALRYRIVERNAAQRRGRPASGDDTALPVECLEMLPQHIAGCVLSNEFFDALPVHRVKRDDEHLYEVYVTLAGGRFVEKLDEPSTPEIPRHFDRVGVPPGDGCVAEVNLDAQHWMSDIAARLDRGYVLTFDYGYEAPDLYAPWRRDGTLRCFYRQSMSSDPYQRIGMQDMTSSVDFTALRRAGERSGLDALGFADQSGFLVRLGIGEGVASVIRERPAEMEEYFARRNVVLDLIDPEKLGRIEVLLQGKGVPLTTLAGFGDGR